MQILDIDEQATRVDPLHRQYPSLARFLDPRKSRQISHSSIRPC
jgi:hypothetical protein